MGDIRGAATGVEAQSFGQIIADPVDRSFAQRSPGAVPAMADQRSRSDSKLLMSQDSNFRATRKSPRIEALRSAQTMQGQS